MDKTYKEFDKERMWINKAFLEITSEGDYNKRIFSFPIPTYNITKDFPWESEVGTLLLQLTSKFGAPYFQNFINSDLDPADVRSMCCRLQLDKEAIREHLAKLTNKGNGLFGAGELTGSVGVVTLNLPKIAYIAKKLADSFNSEDKDKLYRMQFFALLDHYADLAKTSLEIKRKMLKRNLDNGMYPWTKRYLKHGFDSHFSTIGVVGGHEACLNLLGVGIDSDKGQEFAVETLNYLRERLTAFQLETGNLYNLEATPAEGTAYKLARLDKKNHSDIIASGSDEPYYTNSTQLPVDYTPNVFKALEHQNKLQTLYTGGTVMHIYLGESIPDITALKELIVRSLTLTKLPYVSITPTFSICSEHGYITGEHFTCPTCKKDTEVYSRVVGYYRPVNRYNKGKKCEFRDRQYFRFLN